MGDLARGQSFVPGDITGGPPDHECACCRHDSFGVLALTDRLREPPVVEPQDGWFLVDDQPELTGREAFDAVDIADVELARQLPASRAGVLTMSRRRTARARVACAKDGANAS
jgi:hypothetical protein